MEKRSRRRTRDLVTQAASQGLRADIHDGQEHKRSMQGPDTDAQDHPLHLFTSGLQRTAGPYRSVATAMGCPRTSAFSLIATEGRTSRDVSNVHHEETHAPQQSAGSFDH